MNARDEANVQDVEFSHLFSRERQESGNRVALVGGGECANTRHNGQVISSSLNLPINSISRPSCLFLIGYIDHYPALSGPPRK